MMLDVEEIIEYIKSLKRGFDKDLFQSKIDELAHTVETTGLEYEDFHILFKIWLNLTIPITKWVNVGCCLVPHGRVEKRTIDYALRWLLASLRNQTSFSRISFVLDWLTTAMDNDSIDVTALNYGYEIFYNMLTYEVLTDHVVKLVYSLTKPTDVNRRKVLQILDCMKKRECKKSMCRQLQVLLGLFKMYKPEVVPEDIPAIAVHTVFKKINKTLLTRFQRSQNRRNSLNKDNKHLLWINPTIFNFTKNKKAMPLVPSIEFTNFGGKERVKSTNYLDFKEPMSRPSKLRALLNSDTGVTLLSVSDPSEHAFFSHDLHHLLTNCFLDTSPHTYAEKQHLLQRLSALQRALLQGIAPVTRLLAQLLPLWNEKDYFFEILELSEWLSVENPEHVTYIVESLTKTYHRSRRMEKCAILKTMTNMYCNMVFASVRKQHYFMGAKPSQDKYDSTLSDVSRRIGDMCSKAQQINQGDTLILQTTLTSAITMRASEHRHGVRVTMAPDSLTLAMSLLTPSAVSLDRIAELIMLYKHILKNRNNKGRTDASFTQQVQTLRSFTSDLISNLYLDETVTDRENSLIFNKLNTQTVDKVRELVPNLDSVLALRNHLAFAPYTVGLEGLSRKEADNKMWFEAVVDQQFVYLSEFLRKAVPGLRGS